MYLVQVTYWETANGVRVYVNEHELHVADQQQLDAEVEVENVSLKMKGVGYDETVISCLDLDFCCTLK
jgi:hypothetical protein